MLILLDCSVNPLTPSTATKTCSTRGLDSIRLMSLVETWRKAGIDADFTDLAEEPTIAAWLALLTQQS